MKLDLEGRAPRREYGRPSRSASRWKRQPSASTRSSSRAWPPPRACIWSKRARTRATTRWSVSAAQGLPMRRKSPACSASANSSFRPRPARRPRSASSRRPCRSSWSVRIRSNSPPTSPRRPSTESSTSSKREGRARLIEAGDRRRRNHRRAHRRHAARRTDARYLGAAAGRRTVGGKPSPPSRRPSRASTPRDTPSSRPGRASKPSISASAASAPRPRFR